MPEQIAMYGPRQNLTDRLAVCIYACGMCLFIYACVRACVCALLRTMCMCIYIYIYVYVHLHVYICSDILCGHVMHFIVRRVREGQREEVSDSNDE